MHPDLSYLPLFSYLPLVEEVDFPTDYDPLQSKFMLRGRGIGFCGLKLTIAVPHFATSKLESGTFPVHR